MVFFLGALVFLLTLLLELLGHVEAIQQHHLLLLQLLDFLLVLFAHLQLQLELVFLDIFERPQLL